MPYLPKCTNSILNQTADNWELLLIDDGSTDESGAYCDQLSEKDSRIIVHHKENEGLVSARQLGIRMANGEYILFVDADDEIELNLLERINVSIAEKKSDMILFGLIEDNLCETVKSDNFFMPGYYAKERIDKEIIPEMITGDNFFTFHILPNLVCKCINKKWLMSCNYHVSTNVTYGEDADLSYQILPQARSLVILDIYGYRYYKREESMVGSHVEPERIDSLEKDLMGFAESINADTVLFNQIRKYIYFARLVKCPEKICGIDLSLPERVAIYGAGGFGQTMKNMLSEKCVFCVDRNYHKYIGVSSPERLFAEKDKYDVVLVAILNASVCEDIIKKYRNEGLDKNFIYFSACKGEVRTVFV